MDSYECVTTKLDFREFSRGSVPAEVKLRILEAARLTGSGLNSQHWRFVLVQEREGLGRLARDTTTGVWAKDANFAIIVLTNPRYPFHMIDAGRVLQSMQIAGWSHGIVSCPITGLREESLHRDFNIPKDLEAAAIVAFGYPSRTVTGKRKRRRPLRDIAYLERYGNAFDTQLIQ